MMYPKTGKRFFSLVELLVAIAVLSLMMTFLFQFIISAQRVWSGTTNASNVYAQAQVALDVIGNDLQNLRFSNEPAQQCPFYYRSTTEGFYLGYITHTPSIAPSGSFASEAETYLVIVKYTAPTSTQNGTLKRIVLDPSKYSDIFFYYGWPYASETTGIDDLFFNREGSPLKNKENDMDLLAEDILNCHIATYPSPTLSGYATELPTALRLTIDIFDSHSLRPNASNADKQNVCRSFTKLIFLR